MSAAGPPQGARPPGGERREAPLGGEAASAAGPPQGARPPGGERREAPLGAEAASANTPRLSCRDLAIAVPGRTLAQGLDLAVQPGQCWVIVGPNGAGKSSLLAALAGLRAPSRGTIEYDGTPLAQLAPRERARRRGWLPQDSADYFPSTVLEAVLIGRHPHLGRWQWESATDVAAAEHALAEVGLAGLSSRQLGTLSGGERRRTALAALILQDPALLLLDEPSSHLDLRHQIATLDLLTRLARTRGRSVVMVLHELHLALRYADHAIAIGGGRASAGRAEAILTVDAMSTLFGHPLRVLDDGTARTFVPG